MGIVKASRPGRDSEAATKTNLLLADNEGNERLLVCENTDYKELAETARSLKAGQLVVAHAAPANGTKKDVYIAKDIKNNYLGDFQDGSCTVKIAKVKKVERNRAILSNHEKIGGNYNLGDIVAVAYSGGYLPINVTKMSLK